MRYRGEVDGLRALAVVPVILFHAGVQVFSGGFVGVDVFFVISGYLITSILLNDLKSGSFSIVHFYERRARRILPALFLVMFVSLPFAWIWLLPDDMKSFSESLAAVPAFVSNFIFWHQSGYFDTETELKPLIHTWSLAVEEQFYLLFPLFLLLTWRFGKNKILAILAITSGISLAAAHYGAYKNASFTFFMLPTRAWELAIGAFVAFYYSEHNIKRHKQSAAQWGSALGLLLIVYAVFAYNKETPFPSLYTLAPTIGAALIIVFATHETWTGKILSSKPFIGIGLVSYSAYLWHQPIFAFARHRAFGDPSTTLMLSLATASFVLAYLTWLFVERPFRNKHKFNRKQIFVYGVIGSICFILIGFAGRQGADYFSKYRLSKVQIDLLEMSHPSPMRKDCHAGDKKHIIPADACEYFGSKTTWAVFGDSHAVELAYALANELKPYDIGIKHLSFSGCAPSFKTPEPQTPCGEWTDATIAYLDRTPAIKTVVVSYRLNQHLWGYHEEVYPALPNKVSESTRSEVWQSYIMLLRHLRNSGKRVIVVLQAPEVKKRVGDLIFKSGGNPEAIASVPTDWWMRRNAYVTEHLNMIPTEINVINPANLFCDNQECYATRNGTSLYFDDDHMSVAGANVVAQHILRINQNTQ